MRIYIELFIIIYCFLIHVCLGNFLLTVVLAPIVIVFVSLWCLFLPVHVAQNFNK